MSEEETKREKQVRKACERAKETGDRMHLAEYLKMQREDYEQANSIDHLRVMGL